MGPLPHWKHCYVLAGFGGQTKSIQTNLSHDFDVTKTHSVEISGIQDLNIRSKPILSTKKNTDT